MAADGPLILAIDQGTTGSTALLVDEDIQVVGKRNFEFTNHFPAPGQVEHDPDEIWASIEKAVKAVLADTGIDPARIKGIGVTNQRETCLFWDRNTGEPIHRALVWQDRRTSGTCEQIKENGHEDWIRDITGLVVDPYFSGTKAKWLLDNVSGARRRARDGELAFGTIDTYVTWRLTGGQAHVTDPSNASRTLLYNIHKRDWSSRLTTLLGVPEACLPEVAPSSQVYGHTKGVGFLPDGIPVAGMIGDQQGALFGQACFDKGEAKCTYGTGGFILMNTGSEPIASSNGMLTTIGWQLGDEVVYALEGSVFIAGAVVQWLRDSLGIIKSAPEIETLARSVPDAGGVIFVPALTGLGAPHWRPEARGLISGITRGTTPAHIARAALEGVALSIDDVLTAMAQDLGGPVAGLRLDGGAAANNLLMQMQADLLGLPCVRPTVIETTGLGSGLLAGLATGVWSSTDQIRAAWREDRTFDPSGNPVEINRLRKRWAKAVQKA